MHQFTQFVINHWQLWLALAIVLLLIIRLELTTQVKGVLLLTPQQATHLINHEHAVIIDVRNDAEFRRGHLAGAKHIDSEQIDKSLKKLNRYKNKPILVLGAKEQQGIKAGAILCQQGFEHVATLKGGFQAWLSAKMPLVREAANG
ncbi:MAG: hypothetical protein Tsb005_04700 [Gammaproteobacteria bacterium]